MSSLPNPPPVDWTAGGQAPSNKPALSCGVGRKAETSKPRHKNKTALVRKPRLRVQVSVSFPSPAASSVSSPVFLTASPCRLPCVNRCICLPAVGGCASGSFSLQEGAPGGGARARVNQAALQTASRAPPPPPRWVLFSSPVSSCHSKFFSSPPLFPLKSFAHLQPFSEHHFLFKCLLLEVL